MDLAVGAVAITDGIVDVFQQLDVPAGQFAPRYLRINGEEFGLLYRLTGARLPIDNGQRRRYSSMLKSYSSMAIGSCMTRP